MQLRPHAGAKRTRAAPDSSTMRERQKIRGGAGYPLCPGVPGLTKPPRPDSFDFPGAWFQVGPEVIHLLGQSNPDARGRRHFCLWVADVHAAAQYLAHKGLRVTWDTKYKIDGVDRFFTDDPDG